MARRRRRNPSELMLLENPYSFNPSRRRKHRRNPVAFKIPGLSGSLTQGVDLMDVVGGVAGIAGATVIPGMLVKDTTTSTGKALKLAAALGSTIVVGMAVKKMSPGAGKSAVIGGLVGTAAQALAMFTSYKIPGLGLGRIAGGAPIRRLGETTIVSPRFSPDGETINMIRP